MSELTAAEMRERCAKWHDDMEARFRQKVKEVLEIPGHGASCPGLLEANDQMADLHKGYAAAMRALPTAR
jgi:hypothetical protein